MRAIAGQLALMGAAFWGALCLVVAFLYPGPPVPDGFVTQTPAARRPAPAVDEHGSRHQVVGAGVSAQAQVFWEQPGQARVKLTIVLPGEDRQDN